MDVKGKKAIVFGGTSGIGLAAAKQLAELGAEVIAISRNPDRAGDVPAGITLKACDVRDRDALQALFEECAPFDILISAATGGDRAIGPFLAMDMDGFQGSFDKLWGYANVVRYGTEHLPEDGAIVLVSGAPARNTKPGQIFAWRRRWCGGAVRPGHRPGDRTQAHQRGLPRPDRYPHDLAGGRCPHRALREDDQGSPDRTARHRGRGRSGHPLCSPERLRHRHDNRRGRRLAPVQIECSSPD